MTTENPTLKAQFEDSLATLLPTSVPLALSNVHLIGPFDNTDFAGLETTYPPEGELNLQSGYPGKHGSVSWQRAVGLDGIAGDAMALSPWIAPEKAIVVYCYAEVMVSGSDLMLARLGLESTGMVRAWVNDAPVIAPTIPEPANPQDHSAWLSLQPGSNKLLVKICFQSPWHGREHKLGIYVHGYGAVGKAAYALGEMTQSTQDSGRRLLARMMLAEVLAGMGDVTACLAALDTVRTDAYATRWDVGWADAVERQYEDTGYFVPFHEPAVEYLPVTEVQAYPEFWPQSAQPAPELLVVDVSNALPQVEFAVTVLQGLVNRAQPRLYVLHTRYARQDRQWLDELHVEGFTSREISVEEA